MLKIMFVFDFRMKYFNIFLYAVFVVIHINFGVVLEYQIFSHRSILLSRKSYHLAIPVIRCIVIRISLEFAAAKMYFLNYQNGVFSEISYFFFVCRYVFSEYSSHHLLTKSVDTSTGTMWIRSFHTMVFPLSWFSTLMTMPFV